MWVLKTGSNFQDKSVLLQVGDFCGRYTQEIKHFGGDYMLHVVWIEQTKINQTPPSFKNFYFHYDTGMGAYA